METKTTPLKRVEGETDTSVAKTRHGNGAHGFVRRDSREQLKLPNITSTPAAVDKFVAIPVCAMRSSKTAMLEWLSIQFRSVQRGVQMALGSIVRAVPDLPDPVFRNAPAAIDIACPYVARVPGADAGVTSP